MHSGCRPCTPCPGNASSARAVGVRTAVGPRRARSSFTRGAVAGGEARWHDERGRSKRGRDDGERSARCNRACGARLARTRRAGSRSGAPSSRTPAGAAPRRACASTTPTACRGCGRSSGGLRVRTNQRDVEQDVRVVSTRRCRRSGAVRLVVGGEPAALREIEHVRSVMTRVERTRVLHHRRKVIRGGPRRRAQALQWEPHRSRDLAHDNNVASSSGHRNNRALRRLSLHRARRWGWRWKLRSDAARSRTHARTCCRRS